MVHSVQLSRDSAVRLAAELSDVAVKLRTLEAKYGLEEDGLGGPSTGLGVTLLAALRPFAGDAEVAAIMLRGGLNLEACFLGVDPLGLSTFAKQVSCESVSSDLSTCFRSTKLSTGTSVSSAFGFRSRSVTEESSLAPSAAGATPFVSAGACAGSVACAGTGTGGGAPCWRVVPRLSADPGRWSVNVGGCGAGCRALELRRKLSQAMHLPLGKIRVMAEQDDGNSLTLDDGALAANATGVYVCGVPAAVRGHLSGNSGTAPKALSRDQALAMQTELLEGMDGLGSFVSGQARGPIEDRFKEIQSRVLPKYGFRTSPYGIAAMLRAFDEHAGDDEIARKGDTINERLGLRPQFYGLEK
mmetsp:Transcript_58806/g.164195  ORF Transcript_58806/g.164195 Transcript_58806/m.164195 type:complete len:357 (-) Transcript_58806:285-1355(-)